MWQQKLNYKKIPEILELLKSDKEILEKIIKNNILYIGFVSYSDSTYYPKISCDFKVKIQAVKKDGMLFGRKVTEFIDWKTVYENREIVKDLKEDFGKKFDSLEKKQTRFEEKIDSFLEKKHKKESKK